MCYIVAICRPKDAEMPPNCSSSFFIAIGTTSAFNLLLTCLGFS